MSSDDGQGGNDNRYKYIVVDKIMKYQKEFVSRN